MQKLFTPAIFMCIGEVRVNNFDSNLLFGLPGMTAKPSTATVFGNDRPEIK